MTEPAGERSEIVAGMRLTASVVVATYRRLERLIPCLDGIRRQSRAADEVIVVARAADAGTIEELGRYRRNWSELRWITVERPGVVEAYNRGLDAATCDIVAYVDDDAVPRADWLERTIGAYDADPRVAAVGGRDVIHVEGGVLGPPSRHGMRRLGGPPEVGRVQWWGRVVGNHHLGSGEARDVDVLKGVSMSFRRADVAAFGFDQRMRGTGAQVHCEMSICLPLRRRGLRVIYDPQIIVDHFPARRPAGDIRTDTSASTIAAAVHNESLALLDFLSPARRIVFSAWALLVGTGLAPGVAALGRDLAFRKPDAMQRFAAAQRGRLGGWLTHLRRRRRVARAPDGREFHKALAR